MITLSSFDRELNETIVNRGFEYYRKGCVKDLEQVDDNIWRALVEGSDVYDVKITISQDIVKQHRCSCPYDLGEFCKHEIAVLYAIRGDIDVNPARDKDDKRFKRKQKHKTIKEEIQESVDKFTEQEVRSMIIEHAVENEKLRRKIMLAAPPPADSSPFLKKDSYIKMIRSCMRENADRGFIGYYEAGPASEAAHNLIEKAHEYLAQSNYANALPIGRALLEAIYPELGSIDDSNGEFGGCIEEAWHILQTIAEKVPPSGPLGNELFSYTLGQVGKEIYAGWSVEDDFLSVAATLTSSDTQQKQLFHIIDQQLLPQRKDNDHDRWETEYKAENAARIKLKVLRQLGKNKEADILIQETVKYPEIREQYLEQLFTKGELDKAKRIAEEGISIAKEKKHTGIVRKFEEWLCRIAEAEGDVPKVRILLRRFFLDDHQHGYEDYERLKKSFEHDPPGWKHEYDYLVTALRKRGDSYALLDICLAEQQWEDFLKYLLEAYNKKEEFFWPQNSKLRLLENYENVLKEHFPERLIELYQKEIPQSLSGSAAGRAHYQYVCRVLRRMKKMGAEEIVEKLKENFRLQYGNRKALLDELNKV